MKIGSQSSTRSRLKELAEEVCDCISQLPDDILISIISRLPMREAATTRILSSRWRNLPHSTTHLNFPPFHPKTGPFDKYLQEIQEKRFPNYINWINHTLDSHSGGRLLKEFRVHMLCLEGANIERWIKFALAREAEIIDIQMHYLPGGTHPHYNLGLSNLITKNGGSGLKCLKDLSLSAVHVDDREVEVLLSNFPSLESLSIQNSQSLKNLSVVGHSSIKLKHLDISYAWNIESLEVGDMVSLVSLRCFGFPFKCVLTLNNVPKLTEFNTSDHRNNTIGDILTRIPSCIYDQLQTLKLSTYTSLREDLPVPDLVNIKLVELEVSMSSSRHSRQLFPLIEACRTLEKIEVKFLWHRYRTNFKSRKCYVRSPTKDLSPNLKELKVSGYLGSTLELEFALFIMKNAVALEEIIVEPCQITRRLQRMATGNAWRQIQPCQITLNMSSG